MSYCAHKKAKNRPFHVPIPFSVAHRYVFMWCVKGRAFGRASHGGCRNVPEIIGSRATRWISERLAFQPKDERFCKQIMSVRCDKKESPGGHGLGWVDVEIRHLALLSDIFVGCYFLRLVECFYIAIPCSGPYSARTLAAQPNFHFLPSDLVYSAFL